MISVMRNVSLLPYNTFGIDVSAETFVELHSEADLPEISERFTGAKHVLGGGSNVLLTQPVSGLVLLNKLSGISVEKEDNHHIWLRVAGGENWHSFVMYVVSKGYNGIENLALIPGSVGASPIQNIGAYGVEVRETIEAVTGWHWDKREPILLTNNDCRFGYRDSIFKHELKDKVMVTSVLFRLNKVPDLRTSYGAITQELQVMDAEPSVATIAEAVIRIRQSKLPDPKVIGNAGSFFKNPTVKRAEFNNLYEHYAEMPFYNVGDDAVKIPAGWLIEQCGWKGRREGNTGVHAKQALVLVNYGGAVGSEIWQLSQQVLDSIQNRFGILLEREVQIW